MLRQGNLSQRIKMKKKQLKKGMVATMFVLACVCIFATCVAISITKDNYNNAESLNKKRQEEKQKVESLKEEIKEKEKQQLELAKEEARLTKQLETLAKENPEILSVSDERIAYLTFDDGPSENTSIILDFLKANELQATFFVLGNKDPALYRRIIEEGHTLGAHSTTHDYKEIYSSPEAYMKDLNLLVEELERETGIMPSIIRFPGGSVNSVSKRYGGELIMDSVREMVTQAGYIYFDWNVDSKDSSSSHQNKESIVSNVLEGSKNLNKAVVLLHDSSPKKATLDALPDIVKGLRDNGFVFRKITSETTPIRFK